MPGSPPHPRDSFRVVVWATTIRSLLTTRRGTAFALVELGGAAFFAAGIAARAIGPLAPYFLLAAVLLGAALRAVNLEGCALFIPGGLYGTVSYAFGRRAAKVAASALLIGYVLAGALAA